MHQVYLLTGRPGTGKTSLIKQAVAELKVRAGGFYTEEIRSREGRLGFKLVALDGREAILANVGFDSPYRVSKYGVDVDSLDRIGVSTLRQAAAECDLVVVDEIGKMELFSVNFKKTVLQIIGSGKRVLGTIMLSPNPFADAIKHRPEVNVVEVSRANRGQVLDDLRRWLAAKEPTQE